MKEIKCPFCKKEVCININFELFDPDEDDSIIINDKGGKT